MQYGLCTQSLLPLRASATHRAEQVSQLLFGETYRVVGSDDSGEWLRIITNVDLYEGYLPAVQHTPLSPSAFLQASHEHRCLMKSCTARLADGSSMHLHTGSFLPFLTRHTIDLPDRQLTLHEPVTGPRALSDSEWMEYLQSFLNAPYVWGGKSPFGIDCSGLIQLAFRLSGVSLPRDAWQQQAVGEDVPSVEETKTGDLLFFHHASGKIIHVALVVKSGVALHASGSVRYDRFDSTGLYHTTTGKRTHNLHSIKRIDRHVL